jgi:predicted ferric reductase
VSATPNPLWFLDRSSGEVALLLLSVAVVLGVVRAAMPTFEPFLVEGIHRNVNLLAVAFGAVHVIAAVADPFAGIRVVDALVPFAGAYRTTWLAFGVVSGYVFAAVLVSSWPVRRLGRRAWLWLHRLAYLGWVAAVVHSLGTGSDVRNPIFLTVSLVGVVGVLAIFLAVRLLEGEQRSGPLRAAVALVAIVIVVGIGVWVANGPMQPGWARTSGTPPDLLHSP